MTTILGVYGIWMGMDWKVWGRVFITNDPFFADSGLVVAPFVCSIVIFEGVPTWLRGEFV